ncbi:MAG: sporulation protein YqfD [Clostridia bacterium]|nr:sporulation protein YqfD [Clostridia bacterium]
MLIFELVRRFFGYVTFVACGGFPERFINLAARNGIKIWDVKMVGGRVCAGCFINSYKRLRHCARKSGMRLKIEKRVGFPFFAKKYRHRAGLVVGAVLFVALTLYFSSIVWVVEVRGNEEISTERLLSVFSSLGLRAGASKDGIVPDDLQYDACRQLEGIEWVAVNINGAVATIELREGTAVPPIVERNKPCNVVAQADGEIIYISALLGDKCVKVGDGVTKGQVLISGVSQNSNNSVFYRHAMGSIIARTSREIVVEIPLRQQEIVYTGERVTRYAVDVLGFKINLYFDSFDETFIKADEELRLTLDNKSLPLAFRTEYFRPYIIEETVLTPNEALARAKEEMALQLEKISDEIELEKVSYVMGYDENVFTYVAKCTCIEEIGVQKEIIFQKNQQN